VWTRVAFPFREGGSNQPFQAARNLRKKALASAAGLCMIGIVTSPLLQSFSFQETRYGGFSFSSSLGFLQDSRDYKRAGSGIGLAPSESA
jgi:hypothetical protein